MKLTLIALLLMLVTFCFAEITDVQKADYVAYAQNLFQQMYYGDASIIDKIQWDGFYLLDRDFAGNYIALTTDEEKAAFKTKAISEFSDVIDSFDVDPDSMIDWAFGLETEDGFDVSAYGNDYNFYLNFIIQNNTLLLSSVDYDDETY
jgi:hypothetical protein